MNNMKQTPPPAPQRANHAAGTGTNPAAAAPAQTAAAAAAPPRQPYLPPRAEVTTVRTEQGYALSGVPSPWSPGQW